MWPDNEYLVSDYLLNFIISGSKNKEDYMNVPYYNCTQRDDQELNYLQTGIFQRKIWPKFHLIISKETKIFFCYLLSFRIFFHKLKINKGTATKNENVGVIGGKNHKQWKLYSIGDRKPR